MKQLLPLLLLLSCFLPCKASSQASMPIIGTYIPITQVVISNDILEKKDFPRSPIKHPVCLSFDEAALYIYTEVDCGAMTVEVFDAGMLASPLLSENYAPAAHSESIDISSLSSGRYAIHVTIGDTTYVADWFYE